MRSLALVLAITVVACSSEETPAATSTASQCTSRGYVCAVNFPMKCTGFLRDVSDPALKNSCGKSVSDGTTDVPCCEQIPDPPDTGSMDMGIMDSAADGETGGDATSEAAIDAPADVTDASDGG